jgi:TonB-linked SusC/RagA family outer membrane protein
MKMNHSYISKSFVAFACFLLWTLGVNGQDTLAGQKPDSSARISEVSGVEPQSISAAFSTISGDELMNQYSGSITNALNGKLSGLIVREGFGDPGSKNSSLSIRGYGNFYSRGIMIYLDGFETGYNYLESLSPSEIESITVLKDPAELAPYGMKGANGVLLVTTKRGKEGKTKVGFNMKTGTQQVTGLYKPLRSYDYARLYNEATSNDNGMEWNPKYSESELSAYQNGTGTDVDWYDQTLKNSGSYTDANLTFDGGDANARYFAYFGYLNNKGIYDVPTNDETSNALQNKYNIRLNLDFKMFKIVYGKVDVGGIVDDRKSPNRGVDSLWYDFGKYPSNIYPVQNSDGSWTGTSIYPNNPVASIKARGYNFTHDRTLQGRFLLKEKLDALTSGLYLEQSVAFNTWTRGTYSRTRNYERVINGVVQTRDENTDYLPNDDNGTNQWNTKDFMATLGYARKFNKNEVNGKINYLLQAIDVDANQNGVAEEQNIYHYENIGGLINYSYNEKYSANLGFGLSGSDNYAKGNRWGFYPSISASWKLSNEQFLKDNKYLTFLNLRASAGKSGNEQFYFRRYLYMEYYYINGTFYTGRNDIKGNEGNSLIYTPNEDIFAEQSVKYNIGLDATVMDKLSVSLDGFIDKRTDIIIYDESISAVVGAYASFRNIGEMTTKGTEVNLLYKNKVGKIGYFVSGMLEYTNNKMEYFAEIAPPSKDAAQTGKPIGTFFGLEDNGFYDISDFNPDGSLNASLPFPTFGKVQPGDIKYKDLSGDGIVDERDMVEIGAPDFPKTTYSFSMGIDAKGFDFQFMFQGAAGRTVNLLNYPQTKAFANNHNAFPIAEDRWAYYPEEGIDTRSSAKYPRLSTQDNSNNYRNSTFWQKNGNYLKLRQIELGYTLPKSVVAKAGLSNVRINISAINPLSFSWLEKNYGIDPLTTMYPAMKSFIVGININL